MYQATFKLLKVAAETSFFGISKELTELLKLENSKNKILVLPCLLLLIMPILTAVGSTTTALCTLTALDAIEVIAVMLFMVDMGALGGCWVTAIGLVLVIVVIVAAGIIRVDILVLIKQEDSGNALRLRRGQKGCSLWKWRLRSNHLFFYRKGSGLPKKVGERTPLKGNNRFYFFSSSV